MMPNGLTPKQQRVWKRKHLDILQKPRPDCLLVGRAKTAAGAKRIKDSPTTPVGYLRRKTVMDDEKGRFYVVACRVGKKRKKSRRSGFGFGLVGLGIGWAVGKLLK